MKMGGLQVVPQLRVWFKPTSHTLWARLLVFEITRQKKQLFFSSLPHSLKGKDAY